MARLAALTGGGRQAAAGHVVSAAYVRQKLSQRRRGAAARIDPRQRQFQQRVGQCPLRGGGQHAHPAVERGLARG